MTKNCFSVKGIRNRIYNIHTNIPCPLIRIMMFLRIREDEATVKTYYKEKDHIRLQPENSSMEPIKIYNDIIIAGKVIGLFRSY